MGQLVDVPGAGAGVRYRCYYGCGATVSLPYYVCWRCQSYDEYLAGPQCPCAHEPGYECRCEDSCSESDGCPADWPDSPDGDRPDDGEEAGQGPAGPERSVGEP